MLLYGQYHQPIAVAHQMHCQYLLHKLCMMASADVDADVDVNCDSEARGS